MARGNRQQADSLELLLDTICNTFGGILFIAILVAILVQQVDDKSQTGERPEQPLSPAVLEERQTTYVRLQAELESLRKARTSQESLIVTLAPQEVHDLIQNRNQAIEGRDEKQAKRNDKLIELSKQRASIDRTKADIAKLRTDLANAETVRAKLTERIEQEHASRRREIRTPVTRRPSGLTEIGFILRYGRMYVWHKYDDFGQRGGLNTDEFVVVKDDGVNVYTMPIPSAGIPLDGSNEMKQLIAERLRQFSPESSHVTFVVRSDSFEQFAYARDTVVKLGFQYRLLPMNENDPIIDHGATDVRVQ